MAFLCGRRLGPLTAIPHGDALGRLDYQGLSFPRHVPLARVRRDAESEIMIALAGHAAEYLEPGPINRPGAASDLMRALDVALAVIDDTEEATAFVNWLFVRARNELRRPACARALHTLARRIVARGGALRGREIREALRRSLHDTRRRW